MLDLSLGVVSLLGMSQCLEMCIDMDIGSAILVVMFVLALGKKLEVKALKMCLCLYVRKGMEALWNRKLFCCVVAMVPHLKT